MNARTRKTAATTTRTRKTAAKTTATTRTRKTAAKAPARTGTKTATRSRKANVKSLAEAKNLTNQPLDKFSSDCLFNYGSYVVEDRAVPEFRDGLKPVHRAILWSMFELGLHRPGAAFKKSARVVGDALGKYHPHGDTACYGAAVTLANTNTSLIDGKGNWGTPVDTEAAMRYTEARLEKFAAKVLLDPRYLEVVPRDPNYDGSESIPRYLPALLPTLLLIGNARAPAFGVSVGNPSFELKGVADLVCKGLSGKKITDKDCADNLIVEYASKCRHITPHNTYNDFIESGKGSLTTAPTMKADWAKKRIIIGSYAPAFNSVTSVQKKIDAISALSNVSLVATSSSSDPDAVLEIRPTRGTSEDDFFTLAEKIEKMMTAKDSFELGFVFKRTEETTTFHKSGYAKFLNNWCVYRKRLEEDFLNHLIEIQEKKKARLELMMYAVNNRVVIIQALDSKDPDAFLVKKLKKDPEYIKMLLDLQVRKLAKLELTDLRKELKSVKGEIVRLEKELQNPGRHAAKVTRALVKDFLK